MIRFVSSSIGYVNMKLTAALAYICVSYGTGINLRSARCWPSLVKAVDARELSAVAINAIDITTIAMIIPALSLPA